MTAHPPHHGQRLWQLAGTPQLVQRCRWVRGNQETERNVTKLVARLVDALGEASGQTCRRRATVGRFRLFVFKDRPPLASVFLPATPGPRHRAASPLPSPQMFSG